MSNPILSISGLTKSFSSANEKLIILDNLDFVVNESKTIAITGESGSGKSTFLNIAGGLDTADSGEIFAGEYAVHLLDENELTDYRRDFLGLIFQFHYLLKDFTALENIMLPALIAGRKKKEIKELACQLLNDVKLYGRKDHFPTQLSGGERQRIASARSLINSPKLILADEPTGNLDPVNAAIVQDILFSLAGKHKTTLIIVTHDSSIAASTDACFRLQNGKLERV